MAATLADIRTKVRRLTRSPSTAQITDADIDNYINTFILYDFPEHLRLFNLRTVFTFFCDPYIDVYDTNTTDVNDTLYDFKNRYITVHDAMYIAGYKVTFSQSREQFYALYPNVNNQNQITQGDGVTVNYGGTLTGIPVVRNQVLFSSIDVGNNGIYVKDNGAGILYDEAGNIAGAIDYVGGTYAFSFSAAPATGKSINAQTVIYQPARPQAILFYEGKFTLRPIPDQPYRVEMEAYLRPTQLLNGTDVPNLSEWWQYIAYGAAKKIFEDRMDQESVNLILPEFKTQELLVQRRTLVQLSNERVSTVYTEQTGYPVGNGFGWGGGSF